MTAASISNPHVQRLRRLLGRRGARREEGACAVEGRVLIGEAVAAGWEVEAQFVAPGAEPVEGTGAPVHELAAGVIERVASTESPKDVLAVVRARSGALPPAASFVVACAGVADPGNLGTIVRSAEAAGADAVAVTPGTVDPWNPKVLRASAGACFHVPVVEIATLEDLPLTRVGTTSHTAAGVVAFTEYDFRAPVALVMGNEAHGLDAAAAGIDAWVAIPQRGRSESLNVAMAATVLCFEVSRQRAAAPGTLPER